MPRAKKTANEQARQVVSDAVDAEGVLADPSGSVRVFAAPGDWDGMELWEKIAAWISCWMQANPWNPWTQGKDGRVLVNSKTDGTLYYLVDCGLIAARKDKPLLVGTVDVCADATDGVLELGPDQVPDVDPNNCPAAVPAPTVRTISPDVGKLAGGDRITITGTNFTDPITVTIGGKPATGVQLTNDTTVSVLTPSGTAGAADVVVSTEGGTATVSDGFTYMPQPVVDSIAPATGPEAGGTAVTITGQNFTGATGATIGGAALTDFTVVSATSITGKTPAGTGTAPVTVTSPGGSGTKSDAFTYAAAE